MVDFNKQPKYPKKPDEKRDTARDNGEIQIDTTEYTTRLELLDEVANRATSYPEVLKLIEDILLVTQRIVAAATTSLLVIDDGKGLLSYYLEDGQLKISPRQLKLNVNSGIVRWVARTGMPVLVNDVSRDERYDAAVDDVAGFDTGSLLAVPLTRGQQVIGVLSVLNGAEDGEFSDKDATVLSGLASTEALVLLVSMAVLALRNIDLNREQPGEASQSPISGHSRRIREYALMVAKAMSVSPDEMQTIEFGALLHDLGKIGIRDAGLRSSDSLTDYERTVLLEHAVIGADIIGDIPFLEKAAKIVRYHHERYDGKGYPEGLKGDDIPLYARLIAVADAFDNMTTEYPHYDTLTDEEAIEELKRGTGAKYCPVIVKAFVAEITRQKEALKEAEPEIPAPEPEAEPETEMAEDSETWRNRGIELLRANRYEEALEAFEMAIQTDPASAAAWRNRGTALGRMGRDIMALKAINRSIELDPKNASSWHNKATALYRLGRPREGKQAKDVEKQLKKKPGKAELWLSGQETIKDPEEIKAEKLAKKQARKEAKEIAKREAAEAARAKKAEKLARKQEKQEAREHARREAEEIARAEEAETAARKQAEKEAKEKAELEAEEAARAREAEASARERLRQEAEDAARIAERLAPSKVEKPAPPQPVAESKPRDEKVVETPDVWRSRGTALVREGRHEEALKAFMKAIELDPKYTTTGKPTTTSQPKAVVEKTPEPDVATREAEKEAREKAEREAKERARREAEESVQAREAEAAARKQAEQEAKEKARREAEEAAEAKKAEKLAKKQAEEEAKEKAKQEAEETARVKKAEKLTKKQAEKEAKERAKREAKENSQAIAAEKLARKQAEKEAKEKAKQEAEQAARTSEADKLARKQAEQEAKENAKWEAEQATQAKEAEKLAKKQAEKEAKEEAKREAEAAAQAKAAEKLARKQAGKEAKEKAKQEAQEAARTRQAEEAARKQAEEEAREKARLEEEEAASLLEAEKDAPFIESELFEGEVRLEIKSSGFELVEQFKRSLKVLPNLRITLDSWSESEGIIIALYLREPMLLGSILANMKVVDRVYRNKKGVVVVRLAG